MPCGLAEKKKDHIKKNIPFPCQGILFSKKKKKNQRRHLKNLKDFRILPNQNFNSGVPSLIDKHPLLSSRQWMQVLNLEKGGGGRLGEILDRCKKSLLLFYFLSPLLYMKY